MHRNLDRKLLKGQAESFPDLLSCLIPEWVGANCCVKLLSSELLDVILIGDTSTGCRKTEDQSSETMKTHRCDCSLSAPVSSDRLVKIVPFELITRLPNLNLSISSVPELNSWSIYLDLFKSTSDPHVWSDSQLSKLISVSKRKTICKSAHAEPRLVSLLKLTLSVISTSSIPSDSAYSRIVMRKSNHSVLR